MNLYQHILMKI